ncbi:MAG: adenylosuccinate synthase [Holophagaceae bacterium]|nr:adenylosuccinate synthase [Holophagaceae bacterium]
MDKPSENLAILGLQWGDEGKGKVIDLFSASFKNVVRFQGGNNAGHTVVVNGKSIALHQVPSGALHSECFLVIGSGVVLNLEVFHQELERLRMRGIEVLDRLLISSNAHLILPYYIALDNWRENYSDRIGTTGRGIGPAYEMKASRQGIRIGDLDTPKALSRISNVYKEVQLIVGKDTTLLSPEDVLQNLNSLITPLKKCIGNTQVYLHEAWQRQESILFEGAQATMLDIDHGTYPFVTSSNCSIGGLFTGTGLPPKVLDKVLGIAKAYTTRVGAGPFPSELDDSIGEQIRQIGHEFGTTTGRPRRCGWLDTVALRHSCNVSGVDGLGIMKLDVLDGLNPIGIVKDYKTKEGNRITSIPSTAYDWENIEPITEYYEGWSTPTKGITNWNDLPVQAQRYINAIAKETGVPIAYISTGPDRGDGFVPPESWLQGWLK